LVGSNEGLLVGLRVGEEVGSVVTGPLPVGEGVTGVFVGGIDG